MMAEEAAAKLDEYRALSVLEQQARGREIAEAFRAFWRSRPSEEAFQEHAAGLVVSARMLYIMARE